MSDATLAEILEKIVAENAEVKSHKSPTGILVTVSIAYDGGGSIISIYDLSTILGDRTLEGRVEGHEAQFNLTALKRKFAREYIGNLRPKRAAITA